MQRNKMAKSCLIATVTKKETILINGEAETKITKMAKKFG